MKPKDAKWQRARILKDDEHPHLIGKEVWVETGKPKLYPVGGKKRLRLVLSNLRAVKDPWGQAAFRTRYIERIGYSPYDFATEVDFVPASVWTEKDWPGARGFLWRDYEIPEGWAREAEFDCIPAIKGDDILAGWGTVLDLPKIGRIDLGPLRAPQQVKTRYGRELLHMLRRLQSGAQRWSGSRRLESDTATNNRHGG